MDDHGQGSRDGGYYMTVNRTDNLSSIFSNILYSTVYSVEAFDRVTLRYTLPSSFILTMKQEEEMRTALAAQGLADDDIVVSQVDGSTVLTFKNVPVRPENVNGIENYVASISFKLSAQQDAQGAVDAGSASVDKGGQVTDMVVPSVTVPADRCVVVFKVNDAIYEIRDAAMGDPIEVPATDLAVWMDLEMAKDPCVTQPYAVFETSTLTREYGVRWVVGDQELMESYKPGVALSVPEEVLSWIPEGYEVGGWSPALPATMPARNITCAAVLTPEHKHNYGFRTETSGSCTDGIVTHRICSCGESITEQAPAKSHSYVASLSSAGAYKGTTVEHLECVECGNMVEKYVTYQVSKKSTNTVLNLDNYKSEVLTNGPTDDEISMRFYIPNAGLNSTYKVTRIDPDGTKTTYNTTLVNGYLVFSPDHFSIYVIGEQNSDDPTKFSTDDMTYLDALGALAIIGNGSSADPSGSEDSDDPQAPVEPGNSPSTGPSSGAAPSAPAGPSSSAPSSAATSGSAAPSAGAQQSAATSNPLAKLKPKGTALKKLKAGKRSIKITWKKLAGVTGYQICYATSKNFKKSVKYKTIKGAKKTSVTLKKLKVRKTYYVRIRTYKTVKVSGKTTKVYSGWSKAKKVKVTK